MTIGYCINAPLTADTFGRRVLDFDEQPRRPVFDPSSIEPEPFLPVPTAVPTAVTARHVWFAAWLAWVIASLVLRKRSVKRQ